VSGQQHAPAIFCPRERSGNHFAGGWVGPRAGLDGRKSRPHRDSIPGRQAHSQSLYRLTYLAHFYRSVEIKLTVPIPQRNTRTRTHARTHTHAQNITCLLTSQIRERQQHKYYVTGREQRVGIKLRTVSSASSGQVHFKQKRVMGM